MFKNISPYEVGSVMIKDLTFKCEGEGFKFSHLQLGHYLGHLASLISLNR